MNETIMIIVSAAGIPSAVVGFAFWWLERRIARKEEKDARERERRQKEVDEREDKRAEFQFHILQSVNASMALSEATAKAVQRIPEAHCNGDMDSALEYAEVVKKRQKDFLYKQGIENIG